MKLLSLINKRENLKKYVKTREKSKIQKGEAEFPQYFWDLVTKLGLAHPTINTSTIIVNSRTGVRG